MATGSSGRSNWWFSSRPEHLQVLLLQVLLFPLCRTQPCFPGRKCFTCVHVYSKMFKFLALVNLQDKLLQVSSTSHPTRWRSCKIHTQSKFKAIPYMQANSPAKQLASFFHHYCFSIKTRLHHRFPYMWPCMHKPTFHCKISKHSLLHHCPVEFLLIMTIVFFFLRRTVLKLYDAI